MTPVDICDAAYRAVDRYQPMLCLDEWSISVAHVDTPSELDGGEVFAECITLDFRKKANIIFYPGPWRDETLTGESIAETTRHEMLHIVARPMTDLFRSGDYEDRRDEAFADKSYTHFNEVSIRYLERLVDALESGFPPTPTGGGPEDWVSGVVSHYQRLFGLQAWRISSAVTGAIEHPRIKLRDRYERAHLILPEGLVRDRRRAERAIRNKLLRVVCSPMDGFYYVCNPRWAVKCPFNDAVFRELMTAFVSHLARIVDRAEEGSVYHPTQPSLN